MSERMRVAVVGLRDLGLLGYGPFGRCPVEVLERLVAPKFPVLEDDFAAVLGAVLDAAELDAQLRHGAREAEGEVRARRVRVHDDAGEGTEESESPHL